MTLHRLRRLAPRWLPRLLVAWLLALTAGAVSACLAPRATAAGPAPAVAQVHPEHDHAHARQQCDSALGHSTASPAKPAELPKDPRPFPTLPALLLPLDPALPYSAPRADTAAPPPDPEPRYLTTARLRL